MAAHRRERDVGDEVAHLGDQISRGACRLQELNIRMRAVLHPKALVTRTVAVVRAHHTFGKRPRRLGLARTGRPQKEIGVAQVPLGDSRGQQVTHARLRREKREGLWYAGGHG